MIEDRNDWDKEFSPKNSGMSERLRAHGSADNFLIQPRVAGPLVFLFRYHALLLEFFDSIGGFLERAHTHAFEDVIGFGALDVVVGHDLDPVSQRVEDVHALVDAFDSKPVHRLFYRFAVIDDKAEVALAVGDLGSAERELDELVAEIDKRVVIAPAAQREFE